jgi:hypothetical protein
MARLNMWLCHLASPGPQVLIKDFYHPSYLEPIKRPWLQVYIDNILIFSNNPDEHLAHIKEVMAILANNNLYIRSEKCQWMRKSLDYLGFTIQGSTNLVSSGIKPSIKKSKR